MSLRSGRNKAPACPLPRHNNASKATDWTCLPTMVKSLWTHSTSRTASSAVWWMRSLLTQAQAWIREINLMAWTLHLPKAIETHKWVQEQAASEFKTNRTLQRPQGKKTCIWCHLVGISPVSNIARLTLETLDSSLIQTERTALAIRQLENCSLQRGKLFRTWPSHNRR